MRASQRAFAVWDRAYDTVAWRCNHCIGKVLACVNQGCICLGQLGLGLGQRIGCHLVFVLAYYILLSNRRFLLATVSFCVSTAVCATFTDAAAWSTAASYCTWSRGEQQLPFLYLLAFIDMNFLVMNPVTCGRMAMSVFPFIVAGSDVERSDTVGCTVIVAMVGGGACCVCWLPLPQS